MLDINRWVTESRDRMMSADEEAAESSVAWQAGPDAFIEHMRAKADAIQKRIQDEHSSNADRRPEGEGPTEGPIVGGVSSGPGGSPEDAAGPREPRQ